MLKVGYLLIGDVSWKCLCKNLTTPKTEILSEEQKRAVRSVFENLEKTSQDIGVRINEGEVKIMEETRPVGQGV
jgi:hypothetical protein